MIKKIIPLFLIVLVGIVVYTKFINKTKVSDTNLVAIVNYTNSQRGIKFNFPDSNWKMSTQIVDGEKPIIGMFSNLQNNTNLILSHYSKKNEGVKSYEEMKNSYKKSISFQTGYALLSSQDNLINELKVYKSVESFLDQSNVKKYTVTYLFYPEKSEEVYILSFGKSSNFSTDDIKYTDIIAKTFVSSIK